MPILTDFAQDARFTARQLRRNLFYSITVIVTVALAIGATAAMTGVLRATLLNPLPYPHSEQLVNITDHNLKGFKDIGFVSVLRTDDLATLTSKGHPLFSTLGFYYSDDSTLTLPNHEPLRVPAVGVSGGFFPTLGASPLLGRTLTPADDVMNGPQLLVISHRLWQTAFAADAAIIGRVVRIGTAQATVVGVMPPRFDLPASIDLWHPGHISARNFGGYRGDGSRFVYTIARLAPGETPASAAAASNLLAQHLAAAFPATDAGWGFQITDLRTSLFGSFRSALLLLTAAVALVLLAAAINIAGLQFSRNATRTPEFALRSALGITRSRLVRQLLAESLLLVLSGALLGLLLAPALLRILNSRLPATVTAVDKPHVDLTVVIISLTLALLVGILTAILPALRTARQLTNAARSITARSTVGRTVSVLQIALSVILLTLSAGVLKGLYRLVHLPLGFEPSNLQTFTVDLPWGVDPTKTHAIYTAAQQQFAAMPGVESVGALSALPLSGFSSRRTFDIDGQAPTPHQDAVVAEGRSMTPGYLHTLGIRLLAGRDITAHDTDPGTPSVVLINRTLADRYFPGQNAVGKRLLWDKSFSEIVGITGDVQGTSGRLGQPSPPEVFYAGDGGWPHMQFALRTALPIATLEPQLRRIVTAIDPAASPGHFATLTSTVDCALVQPRLNATLLTAFAALSLLLVIVGVYGLFAFEIAQRTRELGLRIALGSTRAGVLTLLLGESVRILLVGLALGLAGSFFAHRLLAANLPDVQAYSLPLLLVTATILAASVLLSTFIPARRASRLDPMQALKTT
jgi:putative ABC transport system permease protein